MSGPREKSGRAAGALAAARRIGAALPGRFWTLFEWLMLLGPIAFGAAAVSYLAACGWALYDGQAAFAGWPLRRLEAVFPVYRYDASLAAWLRDWAVLAWAAFILCLLLRPETAEKISRRLDSLYLRLGLFALPALFLFHLGCVWNAPEQIFSYGAVLGGQVPVNDANWYYQYPFLFASDGVFNEWIMTRPLNAVMRLGLDLLAGWNPPRAIALQAVLLGLSAWLLGLAVLRRWGFYSAVAACALVFLLSKTFLPTFLAQPLGMIWACLSAALLLEALEAKSRLAAFGGLAALAIALQVRPGAIFLLPAAVLWLLVHFWRTWRGAAAQGFWAFTLVGLLLGASMALTSTYVKGNPPSSNFSYTLAALSFGGSQGSEAQSRYKEELAEAKSAEEAARFLYAQAWENIRREPETFIAALADRARLFGRHLPEFLQNSYADRGGSFFRVLAVLAFWSFLWRARPRQKIFWLLVMAGMTASAAVVFHDAGERVMAPGYIFLGLFLAGGLALPARLEETGRLAWPALTLGGLLLILMFSAPALAYRHPPEAVRFLRNNQVPPPAKDEALIWGGGSLAGVLVVPDSEPLPSAVPALPFSSFAADIKNSGAEQYQPLLTPRQPQPPFAFVAGLSGPILIAPPELLFRAEVPLWRVRFMDWALPGPRGHSLWKRVLKAEPLGVPGAGQGTPAGGH